MESDYGAVACRLPESRGCARGCVPASAGFMHQSTSFEEHAEDGVLKLLVSTHNAKAVMCLLFLVCRFSDALRCDAPTFLKVYILQELTMKLEN